MKSSTIKAGLATLALGAVCLASAQSNGPTGFSARLGTFLPTNQAAKDLSASWFNFGVDYKLNSYSLEAPGEGLQSYLGISADYYFSHSNSNLPVALTYNVRSGQLVYSAGVGFDFYNLDSVSDTGTGIGGQVAVAYEFGHSEKTSSPLFVQAKYFLTRKSELAGFGLYVGARF